ncbi:MAG: S49 family peptidase [Alphaproteobacteria bacterium]
MELQHLLRRLPIERFQNPPPVVGVVRMFGVISPGARPWRRALNIHALAGPLERAFKLPNLKAVALAINSPGGSAVQSSLVHKRVRALAAEKDVPVYAFIEDVAASGGYWLACAADEIFADDSSIVGSIGVIFASFGFHEFLAQHGIERRLHTAGTKKSMLDPFRPERPGDVKRLKAAQAEIHEAFMAMVRDCRTGKLKAPEDEIFSGEFWTGLRALELGLVDGIGDVRSVMRDRYGENVKLTVVGERAGWLRRIRATASTPVGSGSPAGIADWTDAAICAVEERLLWSRYGL